MKNWFKERKKKKNLKKTYDVINEIARKREAKGEDCSHWFYTKEELREIKNKKTNK